MLTVAPSSDAVRLPPPCVERLGHSLRPEEAFAALADRRHVAFFDSAMPHERLGRYAYVAFDPFDWLQVAADGAPALPGWGRRLERWRAEPAPGLPPWQGGYAGVIGYEIGRSLERLPPPRYDEFRLPALTVGGYDTLVAFDLASGEAWAISHGLPERTPDARRCAAERRVGWLVRRLSGDRERPRPNEHREQRLSLSAPEFDTPYGQGVRSDFSRDGYLRAVGRAIERLRAGDAFQVNLSQRLLAPDPGDPVALYQRLRERNPAPFGGYFDAGAWQIASASPERFLRVDGDRIETRPIKGTRPSSADVATLVDSEKDRAENVMIVDLLRNDLSRVAVDSSVEVPTLFGVERYAHVHHLVSVVTATLRQELGVADLLAATLPGGSITGAPKVMAQQIIAELEPTARGPYCGSMAWVGFADPEGRHAMDTSVLIRTLVRCGGWVQAPVGGGITVKSDPVAEYDETWHKAAGLIDAVADG